MNPIKIIHLADVHFCPDKKEEALASLRAALAKGVDEGVDLFAIAGDLFDRAIQNTATSGLPELQRVIQQMMDVAPVVAVTGTPTHDVRGCYEVLCKTKATHQFVLIDPLTDCYFLGEDDSIQGDIWSEDEPMIGTKPRMLILGCPEPGKEQFLSGKRLGRDETNEAIVSGMKSMLMGFGAIRREYPDIPCLFVYHGNVAGATMCNGQAVRPGEITIGRDDLAMVGADYYALGHIHLAQQIGDLPAYYGGSVAPWDWGELDQKQFNLVHIANLAQPHLRAAVEHIPFPHPPRKKIVAEAEFNTESQSIELDTEISGDDIMGKQVWLSVRIPARLQDRFDKSEYEDLLLADDCEVGSKVTVEIIPTETVRAGHIQEAKGLREKVGIYGDNSGELPTTYILEKADVLEAEAKASGDIGEGLHIRIDKLILRGAIGIWKGQGKDEVTLDMTQYDDGLIALVGVNGAGKTTLEENLQPYPEMLTRSGTLQDHFRLRDSYRDLYFTDARNGSRYRAFIQIDGQNATGKCDYHLYRDGKSLTDGRKDSYVDEIGKLFGSKALYVRSAFVPQKATKKNPDLADATVGEKKGLFRELGGLDYVQAYSTSAKEKGNAIESEVLHARGNLEMVEQFAAGLPAKQIEIDVVAVRLAEAQKELIAAENKSEELAHLKGGLGLDLSMQREAERRRDAKADECNGLQVEKAHLLAHVEIDQQALELKDLATKNIADYEALQKTEVTLNAEKTTILEERARILAEYQNVKDTAEASRQAISSDKIEKAQTLGHFQQEKVGLLKDIERLQDELEKPLKENCPTCGQVLPEGKLDELRDEREEKDLALKDFQSQEFEIEKEIAAAEKDVAKYIKNELAIEIPEEPTLPVFDQISLDSLRAQIKALDVDSARHWLQQAQEAQVRIGESEKRIEQIGVKVADLEVTITDLTAKVDTDLEERYNQADEALEAARGDYASARDAVTRLEVEQKNIEGQIVTLEKAVLDASEMRQSINDKQGEIADWRYLEKACGPNGIQALELDAMGPGIAEVANRLLSAAYGSRFQIEFRTTRIGGAGSKKRQIEDFQIIVHDSQDGTEAPFEWMSGGESVWAKRAIYDAFGIIRDRNTGQRFLTVMQDEADGALDVEARLAYFRMLEAAHQESGRRHSIVITHSESAQEMIAQKIDMAELTAEGEEG